MMKSGGERLKQLRKRIQLSVRDVARASGMAPSTYQSMELRKRHFLVFDDVLKLFDVFKRAGIDEAALVALAIPRDYLYSYRSIDAEALTTILDGLPGFQQRYGDLEAAEASEIVALAYQFLSDYHDREMDEKVVDLVLLRALRDVERRRRGQALELSENVD
jgi:transcriptional regulator with XRE-family HTH domain